MKKLLIALIVALGFAAGWYWLKHPGRPAAPEDNGPPVARVTTSPLKRQTISRTLEAFGVIAVGPSGETAVTAPYDCTIRTVRVVVGTPVAANQVLLEIDPSPDARFALESARSTFGLASRTLAATQERFDLKLTTNVELLAAQQAEAEARLKLASLEARGLAGDGVVRAAAAGVVTRRDLPAGALAATGTPLLTVSSDGQLEARLGLEARDLRDVSVGQAVMMTSANRGDGVEVASVVRSAGAALDAATGAADVRVPVPAGAHLLLGEHVIALIEVARKDDAIVVPRGAVLPDGDKQVLYLVRNGRAVKRAVTTGLANDTQLEVLGDGLQAGDAVVTLGNYELEDGMAVQVRADDGTGPAKPLPEAKP
jgi:RND family efflux transporter MFP subunit